MFLYQDLRFTHVYVLVTRSNIHVCIHSWICKIELLIGIYDIKRKIFSCNELISLVARSLKMKNRLHKYVYDWYSGGMRELLQCTSGCLPVVQWSDSLLPRNLMANCQYLCFHHHWTFTRMISPLTSRC